MPSPGVTPSIRRNLVALFQLVARVRDIYGIELLGPVDHLHEQVRRRRVDRAAARPLVGQ
ncbi:MAG: hypothetical protein M0C28_36690 [Candidatus Moduliflexus flocculans]|nr:hypothetical protein [Candidatus Moduliflexus flocculans]